MDERDVGSGDSPQRHLTNHSLQLERHKADADDAKKRDVGEEAADEVVRLARSRADQLVQTARDDADSERYPQSSATEANSELARAIADGVLQHERSTADAVLEDERAERKRYLADFLAIEREATNQDLIDERAHTDTVIAARDEFLATVSHDLRSMLCGVSLNVGLLVKQAPEGPDGDKMRRHGDASQRLVTRMNRLVGDLLDIASIEAGKLALLPEQVDVGEILRETLDAFESIAAAKRITLESDATALPLFAFLDSGRILQVLANLVSNAIKFTAEEGRILIGIRAANTEIVFAVRDTGVGIPEDALPHVFERFRQVSRDRRGLGLGLHISRYIIEEHGGRMWAESKLGAGSTFHFTLPVAPIGA